MDRKKQREHDWRLGGRLFTYADGRFDPHRQEWFCVCGLRAMRRYLSHRRGWQMQGKRANTSCPRPEPGTLQYNLEMEDDRELLEA